MALFSDPFRELDRVASSLLERVPSTMPMDLFREGDHYILNADLPGMDPGSIDVDIDGQLLTIRAQRTLHSGEGVKWLVRERMGGSLVRQFTLGDGVDRDQITAHYDNGVLSVMIPVSERARARKIEVQTGGQQQTAITAE